MVSTGRGARAVLVGSGPAVAAIRQHLAKDGTDVTAVESAADGVAALAERAARDEPADVVVLVAASPQALVVRDLTATDEAAWVAAAETPIADVLLVLQAAHRSAARPCRVVVVVPSTGITGQRGLVPLCAAAEGVRALAKSAARTWGAEGLRVNVVAVDAATLAGEALGDPPHLTPPSLPVGDGDELGELVALACSDQAARVTGMTFFADAGVTMLP